MYAAAETMRVDVFGNGDLLLKAPLPLNLSPASVTMGNVIRAARASNLATLRMTTHLFTLSGVPIVLDHQLASEGAVIASSDASCLPRVAPALDAYRSRSSRRSSQIAAAAYAPARHAAPSPYDELDGPRLSRKGTMNPVDVCQRVAESGEEAKRWIAESTSRSASTQAARAAHVGSSSRLVSVIPDVEPVFGSADAIGPATGPGRATMTMAAAAGPRRVPLMAPLLDVDAPSVTPAAEASVAKGTAEAALSNSVALLSSTDDKAQSGNGADQLAATTATNASPTNTSPTRSKASPKRSASRQNLKRPSNSSADPAPTTTTAPTAGAAARRQSSLSATMTSPKSSSTAILGDVTTLLRTPPQSPNRGASDSADLPSIAAVMAPSAIRPKHRLSAPSLDDVSDDDAHQNSQPLAGLIRSPRPEPPLELATQRMMSGSGSSVLARPPPELDTATGVSQARGSTACRTRRRRRSLSAPSGPARATSEHLGRAALCRVR
jgi:hypothetical protein